MRSIHSDRAAARASGLPDSILHGTATMAKCVTAIVNRYGDGDPSRVARVRVGTFSGMVLMPSVVTCRILAVAECEHGGIAVFYDALNGEGQKAIKGGLVELRQGKKGARL